MMKNITITYQQSNLPKEEMEDRRHRAFELLFDEVLRIERSKKTEKRYEQEHREEVIACGKAGRLGR